MVLKYEGTSRIAAGVRARRKTERRLTPLLLVILDLGLVYLAFVAAYWVRYDLKIGPTIRDQLGFDAYLPLVLPLLSLMFVSLWVKGAYRLRLGAEFEDEISTIFSAATITVATIVVITAMLQKYQYSRGVIVYLWIGLIVFLVLGRLVYRWIMSVLYRHGIGVRRLLVVGATDVGKMIMQGVAGRRDLGYELVGFVHARSGEMLPSESSDDGELYERRFTDFGRFRALGFTTDVPQLIERERVDEVIIALPASSHEEVLPILQHCETAGIGFKIVPDTFELSLGQVRVDDIAGIPLLDVRERPMRGVERAFKRATDVILSLILLVLFSPILLITAVLIRLESSGPVILVQERVGQDGRRFRCYKFRSMRADAEELRPQLHPLNEAGGPLFKIRADPRRTRVGAIIRRHSIDELPQLWNVLRGEMSLVGPRPALPEEVGQYEVWHRRRLQVRPGITGLWQVSGRSDLPFDEMVMLDIYYIENWSLGLDLKIILRTVMAMITGRGAY
jgi:exopolysaccharide biosynthesis polyprenyl glycosylphosphotransferase